MMEVFSFLISSYTTEQWYKNSMVLAQNQTQWARTYMLV